MSLKRTILLSIFVHFLLGVIFQVKLGFSNLFTPYHLYEISFLGSILDGPSVTALSFKEFDDKDNLKFWEPSHQLVSLQKIGREDTSVIINERTPLIDIESQQSPEILKKTRRDPLFRVEKSPHVTLSGEVLNRMILFQPDLEEHFMKEKERLSKLVSIAISFDVYDSGVVSNVQTISSSGDPYLDTIGMRYVRRWRFMPQVSEAEKMSGKLNIQFSRDSL